MSHQITVTMYFPDALKSLKKKLQDNDEQITNASKTVQEKENKSIGEKLRK